METNHLNHWIKCISTEGHLRGVAIQATELIRDLGRRHALTGSSLQGLGESVLGALLFASYCKQGQRINLNIRGSGLVKQALVDAYPDGAVRGYVIPRDQIPELGPDQGPWGEGLLSVLRTQDKEGEQPYIGTVPLLTGFLAKDLSFYWLQSEQVPSVVGLFVNLKGEEMVSASGFLVQAMPGAPAEEIRNVEEQVTGLKTLGSDQIAALSPKGLLCEIFQNTPFLILEETPVLFRCTCSWARVQRALALLGATELQEMLEEDRSASVKCDFCSTEYTVDEEGLQQLIRESLEKTQQ